MLSDPTNTNGSLFKTYLDTAFSPFIFVLYPNLSRWVTCETWFLRGPRDIFICMGQLSPLPAVLFFTFQYQSKSPSLRVCLSLFSAQLSWGVERVNRSKWDKEWVHFKRQIHNFVCCTCKYILCVCYCVVMLHVCIYVTHSAFLCCIVCFILESLLD